MDSPTPGMMDVAAGITLLGLFGFHAAKAAYTTISEKFTITMPSLGLNIKTDNDEIVITAEDVIATDETEEESPYRLAELITDPSTGTKFVSVGPYVDMRGAINAVLSGNNVMCNDYDSAFWLARWMSPCLVYEIDKNQKNGILYYYHFHVNGSKSHIWHYGPGNEEALITYARR